MDTLTITAKDLYGLLESLQHCSSGMIVYDETKKEVQVLDEEYDKDLSLKAIVAPEDSEALEEYLRNKETEEGFQPIEDCAYIRISLVEFCNDLCDRVFKTGERLKESEIRRAFALVNSFKEAKRNY